LVTDQDEDSLVRLAAIMERSPAFGRRIRELEFLREFSFQDQGDGPVCANIIVACPALERVQLHHWYEVAINGLQERLNFHAASSEMVRTALRRLIIDVDLATLESWRKQEVGDVRFKALRLWQTHALAPDADMKSAADLIVDILLQCDRGGNPRPALFDTLIFGRFTQLVIEDAPPLSTEPVWALAQRLARDKAGSLSCTVVFPSDVTIERLLDEDPLYRERDIDGVIEKHLATTYW
jgi:hypothetical protein